MRVIFSVHMAPPYHNSGAEYYAWHIAKYLQQHGHHVRFLLRHNKDIPLSYVYEGIECMQLPLGNVEPAFSWGECFFTHLDQTRLTAIMGMKLRRRVFWMCHNTFPYKEPSMFSRFSCIYNNSATEDLCKYPGDNYTLPPPVDWRHYDVNQSPIDSQYITLINLNENKGGKFLTELAKALPQYKFLGVTGSYEHQFTDQPPNVTVWPQQTDIREAYKVTRLLIVPSKYESWSMCATEAMCNGIPVIASSTFGLMLNLKEAGVFIDEKNLRNVSVWAKEIRKFNNEEYYLKQSDKCTIRSRELDPQITLAKFYEWFISMAKR